VSTDAIIMHEMTMIGSKRSHRKAAFLARESHDGRVYWSVRSSEKPRQRVLCNLGRVPEDPAERERFLVRARLAMHRFGLIDQAKGLTLPPATKRTPRPRYVPRLPQRRPRGESRFDPHDRPDRTGWDRHGNPRK